jgi:hypothetical protein
MAGVGGVPTNAELFVHQVAKPTHGVLLAVNVRRRQCMKNTRTDTGLDVLLDRTAPRTKSVEGNAAERLVKAGDCGALTPWLSRGAGKPCAALLHREAV